MNRPNPDDPDGFDDVLVQRIGELDERLTKLVNGLVDAVADLQERVERLERRGASANGER